MLRAVFVWQGGPEQICISSTLVFFLRKKVYWWSVKWQKGMQGKTFNQKCTVALTWAWYFLRIQIQACAGLYTPDWESTGARCACSILNIALNCRQTVGTYPAAVSGARGSAAVAVSVSRGSARVRQRPRQPVRAAAELREGAGGSAEHQDRALPEAATEQDRRKQGDFIAIKSTNLYKPTF